LSEKADLNRLQAKHNDTLTLLDHLGYIWAADNSKHEDMLHEASLPLANLSKADMRVSLHAPCRNFPWNLEVYLPYLGVHGDIF
jgi:hypothetical protein